jgi:hypothetical protein
MKLREFLKANRDETGRKPRRNLAQVSSVSEREAVRPVQNSKELCRASYIGRGNAGGK